MIRRVKTWLLAVMLLFCMFSAALAVNPDEILDNPVLEKRARDLSAEIRCMVCQNQSIDDSDAEVARDLRILIRERLVAGDSDEAVLDYLVSRFGEFVLLKPRFSMSNAMLWLAPFLVLLFGLWLAYSLSRRKTLPENEQKLSDGLSKSEQKELTKILDERD